MGDKNFLSLDGLVYYTEKIKEELGAYIHESFYGFVDGTIENVSNNKAISIRDYCFYQHQSLISAEFINAIMVGDYAFYKCPNLARFVADLIKTIGLFAFKGCTSLKSANLPNATAVGNGAFDECTSLSYVSIPIVETIEPLTFRKCESLTSIDLPAATTIKTQAFWSSGIASLTLRSNTVCTLENADALAFTPIEEGVGYIYVPSSLVNSYKAAENWSVYANQIQAIV